MLVRFVVVGDQVIDTLEQGRQSATVVLFLHEELLLGEDLHEVDKAIARLSTKLLGVGRQVCDHGHDGLVDRLEEARACLNQFEYREEDEVVVGN